MRIAFFGVFLRRVTTSQNLVPILSGVLIPGYCYPLLGPRVLGISGRRAYVGLTLSSEKGNKVKEEKPNLRKTRIELCKAKLPLVAAVTGSSMSEYGCGWGWWQPSESSKGGTIFSLQGPASPPPPIVSRNLKRAPSENLASP
jgi:hypothetical protein